MADLLPVLDAILTPKGESKLAALESRVESWDIEDLTREDAEDYRVLKVVEELGIMPATMTGQEMTAFLRKGYVELQGQLDTEEYVGRIEAFEERTRR